jgi:hypothetical protein
MTYDDVVTMVEEIGLPCAYDHFAEGESPDPPFVVFLFPDSDNFFADGVVYQQRTGLSIELYTDIKEPKHERKIERVLASWDVPWNKTETWIEDEKLYEVRYGTVIEYDSEPDEEKEDNNDVGKEEQSEV